VPVQLKIATDMQLSLSQTLQLLHLLS